MLFYAFFQIVTLNHPCDAAKIPVGVDMGYSPALLIHREEDFHIQLCFPDKSADVRRAQYETGSRTPKADITAVLAQVLDVAQEALNVPAIASYISTFSVLLNGCGDRAQFRR